MPLLSLTCWGDFSAGNSTTRLKELSKTTPKASILWKTATTTQ
ncbi:hypothetical protein [[Kitasatospora] papulosa]